MDECIVGIKIAMSEQSNDSAMVGIGEQKGDLYITGGNSCRSRP